MRLFIYAIENLIDGKTYVGQTNDPVGRWRGHLCGRRQVVDRAIQKHGAENFSFSVLGSVSSQDDADATEVSLIELFGTIAPDGYNVALGGISGWNKGRRHSEESRAKIRAAQNGRRHTTETRAKMSESAKRRGSRSGWKHTAETRANMSAAQRSRRARERKEMDG